MFHHEANISEVADPRLRMPKPKALPVLLHQRGSPFDQFGAGGDRAANIKLRNVHN